MILSDLINKEILGGKSVYSFEKHHYAMIPWHEIRQACGRPVRLLTLDYHTDTKTAFIGFACQQVGGVSVPAEADWKPITEQAIKEIQLGNLESVCKAVTRLRYDEHIEAAVKSELISIAFVLASHSDQGHIISNEQKILDQQSIEQSTFRIDDNNIEITVPGPRPKASPPYTYAIPKNRIVILENRVVHDDEDRSYKDAVIESRFLKERLDVIDNICKTGGIPRLTDEPFILDIDLDYFNTKKSIEPDNAGIFYGIIRQSAAITIARESSCVQTCQIDGEDLSSDYLESALKLHILNAMQQT